MTPALLDSFLHWADAIFDEAGNMPRGVFRDGAFVHVSYDGLASVPISHALYRQRGYEPPLEELPTRAKFEARGKVP